MVKKCIVKLNNDAVTVVVYNGIDIQLPSIHKEAKFVNVIFKDGKYIVVDDDYIEPKDEVVVDTTPKSKKKVNKKTTLDENAKDINNTDVNEHLIDGE
jgi:hypothetical protein